MWGTSDRPHCSKGPLGNRGAASSGPKVSTVTLASSTRTAAALFVAAVRVDVGDRHLIIQAPRQVAEGDR